MKNFGKGGFTRFYLNEYIRNLNFKILEADKELARYWRRFQ